jgi:hypothetical protein
MDESQKLVDQVSTEVERKFSSFTYPIYAFIEGSNPILIGTCFALRYRDRNILVTAAHVIDNSKKATLALGTPSAEELVTIEGEFHVTGTNNKDREEDPFDFAWHELTDEEAEKVACIREDDLEVQAAPERREKVYVAMGYPVSKNNKIRPDQRRARRLVPKRANYMNLQSDAAEYFEKRGMASATHIAIRRENRSLNSAREEENTIGHRGLSGGPLIDSGMQLSPPGVFAPKVREALIYSPTAISLEAAT